MLFNSFLDIPGGEEVSYPLERQTLLLFLHTPPHVSTSWYEPLLDTQSFLTVFHSLWADLPPMAEAIFFLVQKPNAINVAQGLVLYSVSAA